MDFEYSPKVEELRRRLADFIDRCVLPYNAGWHRSVADGVYPPPFLADMKALARSEGLWNLFLPDLRPDEPGTRLTNLEYAPLAEIMGRLPWASEVFNCSAPDTGNMELLHRFASPEQRRRWLAPLLAGEIRSIFAMSEPDVASSDATNIQTSIRREGDELVINGRKWFITGALHPDCRLAIVLGRSGEGETEGEHGKHSMVLVLRAAWRLDRDGNKAGRVDVAAIKVVCARLQTRVVDRAIQVFGAMGLAPDTPLAYFWTWGRALRLLDGPDEVHLRTVARHELGRVREEPGRSARYFTLPEQLRDPRR